MLPLTDLPVADQCDVADSRGVPGVENPDPFVEMDLGGEADSRDSEVDVQGSPVIERPRRQRRTSIEPAMML